MAEALAHIGLRIAGATIDKNGSYILPFIVENLNSHFGVLTVKTDSVIYHLKPLQEIEKLHKSKSNQFAVDAMLAVDLVRKGLSIVFVVCAIIDGDSFTRLCVYPREYLSKPMYQKRCTSVRMHLYLYQCTKKM